MEEYTSNIDLMCRKNLMAFPTAPGEMSGAVVKRYYYIMFKRLKNQNNE